jgi:hypothetical protein
MAAQATALQILNGESVTVRGFYDHGKVSGFEELYVEDIVDNATTALLPAPVTLQVADLARDARVPAKWFQKATVTISATDPLVMYDFSPAEFRLQGPCPAWEGFGLIPKSVGAPAPAGCNGAVNPPGTAPAPSEILVGRQYFHGFYSSSDCACAAFHHQTLVSAASSVSGTIGGILILEIIKGSTTSFQVFEPTSKAEFPIN